MFLRVDYLTNLISSMTNIVIDTNSFHVNIDTAMIWDFEKNLRDTLMKNTKIILYPNNKGIEYYYRQYVGFIVNEVKYLFVGFHINENNEVSIENKQLDSSKVNLSEFQIIMNSRKFLFMHYKWVRYDNQFFVLYNFETKKFNFVYFDQKIGNE